MRRFPKAFWLAFIGPWLVAFAVDAAQPTIQRQAFPIVRNGAAQINSEPVTLDGGDNSFVGAAASSDGLCTFVAYIDRDDGNRLLVKQIAGDKLIDVKLPPDVRQTLARVPAYTAPGTKQAAGTLVVRLGILSLIYTTRDEGDPDGPFRLKKLDIPEPPCQF